MNELIRSIEWSYLKTKFQQCDAFRHDGLGSRRALAAEGDCCEHDRCNSLTPDEMTSPIPSM